MRIFAISDLHLEHCECPDRALRRMMATWPASDAVDTIVLAGDLGAPLKHRAYYEMLLREAKARYKHVVFTAGNHEYYGCAGDRARVDSILAEMAQETGTHFLQRSMVELDGVRFVGATLWTIVTKAGLATINDVRAGVFEDHVDYTRAFVHDYEFLDQALSDKTDMPTVVVTHHLPSRRLIHTRFQAGDNSPFCVDVVHKLVHSRVPLWFCGHTHEFVTCEFITCRRDVTRVVANPVGYPDEYRQTPVDMTTVYTV